MSRIRSGSPSGQRRRSPRRPPAAGALRWAVERLEQRLAPATFLVTTTADNGDNVNPPPNSLRAAILGVNASLDADNTINFDIPGTGLQTIAVTGDGGLPDIVKTVTIDGFSQPGSGFGAPLIQLVGVNTTNAASGLTLVGVSGCLIRGLNIINFDGGPGDAGVRIIGGSNNRVQGNFLGVNAVGTAALPNRNGVIIEAGSTGNVIGTDGDGVNDAAEGNIISGSNARFGVEINGILTTGNRVAGNFIGTDITGTLPLPNLDGVEIDGGASGNIIGTNGDGTSDALERNIISGNGGDGVVVQEGSDNRVSGNFIGTDASGTAALGNSGAGVDIAQGTGNIIGTNGDGVDDAAERNVISGNQLGVVINSDNNRVSGNFIGTDVSGMVALGNGGSGVVITQGTGNIIGTNGDGVSDDLERNIISANSNAGITIGGNGNRVSGNFIGTNASGTATLGAPLFGILITQAADNIIGTNGDGVSDGLEGNLISGRRIGTGVNIAGSLSTGNRIAGNLIGTDLTGTQPLPFESGVVISGGASGNIIGANGDGSGDAAEGNIIAFNSLVGVAIIGDDSTGNRVSRNSIFANGNLGGIDLGGDGPSPNQPTNPVPGPNHLQNFPIITAATSTTVSGTLNSTPGRTFVLEFFAGAEPSGEGRTFLGTTTIATDAAGDAAFTATPVSAIPAGQFVTATATDTTTGDTSEFSSAFNASPDPSVTVTEITDVNQVAIPFPYLVPLGTSVHDTATILDQIPGLPATGTVTYRFFTTIDGTGAHTDQVVTLNPDGTVPESPLHGPLAAGAYSFIVIYSGDTNYQDSISAVEPLTVQQGTSTTSTVIVDSNHAPITSPAPLGTTVTDTATVAGTPAAFTPTGTVTYQFFATIDGTGAHTDEVVTLNPDGTVPDSALHGSLAAGAYSFVAVYSGDTNYLGSTSAVEPLTVGQGTSITSTVIVDSSHAPITSPAPLGETISDTATVAGTPAAFTPTGTVTYQFFTTIDGTGPHTDEVITLNPDGSVPDSAPHGPLAAGAFSFIAVYSGDSNYVGSTSPVEPLTVQQSTSTSATVVVDPGRVPITSPVPLGTSVHDTATISGQVSALPATGTLTYQFFTTIDGTDAHTDQVVTLNPDGTVPDSALNGPLAAGVYSFIAVYSGDSNYAGSTSAVEPLTVASGTPATVTEITDVNNVAIPFPYVVPLGASVHDSATIGGQVSGLPATGTLTYEFFTTIDGTGAHTDEVVTLNPDGSVPDSALLGPLAAGAHSFVAVYSGDSNYLGSTSDVEPLTVGSGTPGTDTQITDVNHVAIPFPYAISLGTSVHDTATIVDQISGLPATGTVTYRFFTTIDGTGAHTDQVVTLNPDGTVPESPLHGPLAAGAYSFVAVYSGDSNYPGSTSAVEPLTVQQGASTSSTVIVDANHASITSPVPLGTTVGDTATVAGTPAAFTPTGTVTYQFFTTIDGTGAHTDEIVTLNPDGTVPDSALHGPLAAGAYSFVAVYSGDSNYQGAISAVEPLTVQQGTSSTATVVVDANHSAINSPVPLGTSVHDTATIIAQVSGLPATGTVTYQFFTTIDGTGTHTDELANLNPDGSVPDSALHGPLAAGAHSFIAVYSGDSNYAGSTSPVEPLTVQQGTSTSATLIVDANRVAVTSRVPLSTSVHDTSTIGGQVSGLPATGTLTYEFFVTIDGTGTHTDEVVALDPDGAVPDSALHGPLAAGAYSFVAVYSGDGNYPGSTSAVEPLTVESGTPATVTEITDVNQVAIPFPYVVPLGTSARDTATILDQISGLPATGTVTYEFFTTIDGTGPHIDQVVTLNPDGSVPASALHGPLAAGAYSFVAVYSGDSNYLGSTSAVEPLTVQQGVPVPPPSITSLERFGFHAQPTALVLTFSSALDPTRAQDMQNYTLTPVGPHGHVGARIRIVAAVYDPLAHTVTLHPAHRLCLFRRFELVVNGMPPAGLADPSGILLDGLGNGIPGSDYVRNFGPGILAGPYRRISSPTNHQIRHLTSGRTHSSTTPLRSHRAALGRTIERTQPPAPNVGLRRLPPATVDAVLGTLDFPLRSRRRDRSESRGQD